MRRETPRYTSTMTTRLKDWAFPVCILLVTGFGVFVLPFLLPPPYIAGVSAANVAGFNNKVASIVAATIGIAVFCFALQRPTIKPRESNEGYGLLSRRIIIITTTLCGILLALFSYLIASSHVRYASDAGYFMDQISKHTEYGRKLYDDIEFPYGPLIFYGPILIREILSPFHISLNGAYYTTLVIEHIVGLLLVAYVLDNLPMLRKWKTLLFLLCALETIQFSFGLNYTLFRFIVPAALLIVAIKRQSAWSVAACFFIGEVISLAVSPEMGFAFGASSVAYAAYCCFIENKMWLVAMASPFLATGAFLLVAGGGYLRMLKLFAHGLYNLIVEPLPHILVFLVALVWLIPISLAFFFRERRREAPMLAALYILALALLPVAFGRADPGHVFFDGLIVFLLSFVAVSYLRPNQQTVWAACVTGSLLWTAYVNIQVYQGEWRVILPYGLLHRGNNDLESNAISWMQKLHHNGAGHYLEAAHRYEMENSFEVNALQSIVGNAPVATPFGVPLAVEEALKRSGKYVPAFYFFQTAVLDTTAEDREIREFNTSQWALIPKGTSVIQTETPATSDIALGVALPYPTKRSPYMAGQRFGENLKTHWTLYGAVGTYEVYRQNAVSQ
jgi:hypothetical protein